MSVEKEKLKKKSLMEIEAMILEQKQKMGHEKDLKALSRLSSELAVLQDIREQKQGENIRLLNKGSQAKPELKSYEDYVKSKR
jgi:hypothetical protein